MLAVGILAPLLCGIGLAAEPDEEKPVQEKGSQAQKDEPKQRFKEEIKVVAPPIVEGEHLTPFATQISSVSARQVEDLNAGDLAAALRRVPGVSISRYNLVGSYGGGDGGAIYVRGQGSGRPGAEIATMIDGIPRFVSVWTHPLLDVLASDIADRIDVYKSTQPVLFGNMAFAGVDLVPKRVSQEGMATRVMGSAGGYSTRAGVIEHGARIGDLDYYVFGSQRQSDGHRANADGRVQTLYGRVGYEVASCWNASVQVHSSDSWAHDPGALGSPQPPQTPRFAVTDTLSIATLTENHGSHSGSVKLFYDGGSIDWLQWDGARGQPFTTVTDYSSYGLHAQERVRLAGRTDLVVGFDHDRYGGSSTETRMTGNTAFPELMLRNDGAYAMVSRAFGTEIELTPSLGVRYTDSRDFGGNWGGQAGLVVRRGATELHANLARSFNLPGVYAAVMYAGWGRGDGWKELEPELLDHVELGIGHQLSPTARLEVTVFRDSVTDALRFVPPPPPPPMFANIGDYTVRGVEATVSLTPTDALAFFTGATYLDPHPADVPNSPQWSLVAGAAWAALGALRINADAEWVDTQAVLDPRYATSQAWIGSYLLLNLKASYLLAPGSSVATEVFVAGENLTESEYEYRPGYPAPGRTISAGLDVRF